MTPQQKISILALSVFAIAVITLGLVHVKQGIFSSIAWNRGPVVIDQDAARQETAEQLNAKDTDADGLSDYYELTVLSTSPYIPDTDGDGIDDREEYLAGTDPLCAQGTICTQSEEGGQALAVEPDAGLFGIGAQTPSLPALDPAVTAQLAVLQRFLSGEGVTVEEIRALMVQSGADADKVNQVSDEDLLTLYQKARGQLQQSVAADAAVLEQAPADGQRWGMSAGESQEAYAAEEAGTEDTKE